MEGINGVEVLDFQLQMRHIRQGACGTPSPLTFHTIRDVGELAIIKTEINIVELNNIYPMNYGAVRVRTRDNRW